MKVEKPLSKLEQMYKHQPVTHRYKQRLRGLYDDASVYRKRWKDIVDHMLPDSGRYLVSQSDKTVEERGADNSGTIINGTAEEALRTLAAGMQGGLTSPSRPWFTLATPDTNLMEFAPVKTWLFEVKIIMLYTFARTNFYNSIHSTYEEHGAFGTGALLIEDSLMEFARFRSFTIGEYYVTLDHELMTSAFYRHFSMTAKQMYDEFGETALSEKVINALMNNKPEYRFEVVHAIEPNENVQYGKLDMSGMEYESVYFETKGDPDKLLRRKGYRTKPFVVPRWKVKATDTYGISPAMTALGDIKMLQDMEAKKLEALDKEITPAMNATPDLKAKGGTVVPGGINYVEAQSGFAPTYQVKMNIPGVSAEIQNVEQRIQSAFYSDLFLSVLRTDKRMTATEVAERHEEKLLMLGPVLERLEVEMLDPIVNKVFDMLNDRGMLPPPPEELEGVDLEIEYVSTLAAAQKAVDTEKIERVVGFVMGMSEVNPEILDKLDADQSVDKYASMIGAPPEIVRSDADVEKIRGQRAEQQAEQQKKEDAAAMVEGAKTMSETPMGQDSMLDYVQADQEGGAGVA